MSTSRKPMPAAEWLHGCLRDEETGRPRVFYHGTRNDFLKFRRRPGDIGIHFGTLEQAQDRMDYLARTKEEGVFGTSIRPVLLRIKKPLRMDDIGSWNAENMRYSLRDLFPDERAKAGAGPSSWTRPGRGLAVAKSNADMRAYLESRGYDGIVYRNTGETGGSEPFRARIAAAKVKIEATFGVRKSCFSVEDQKCSAYREWREAQCAYAAFREANAQDSYIAFHPEQIRPAIGLVSLGISSVRNDETPVWPVLAEVQVATSVPSPMAVRELAEVG